MTYQPPKKNFWAYQFQIPNIGNDGKEYMTKYEFRIDLPNISEFEREQKVKDFWIETMVTVYIIQGLNRIKSKIRMRDFIVSPLCRMLSDSSHDKMFDAIDDVGEAIAEARERFLTAYGTYYNNGTVRSTEESE